jgi:hypothetical protein
VKLLLSILLIFCIPAVNPTDCKLKRDEDGVKVYTCKAEGAKLKSLRAEFFLKGVKIDELETFLMDVKGYTSWQYNMIESTVIKKVSDQDVIYRTEVEAPWPVENRELIVRYTSQRDTIKQTMDIVIENIDMQYPRKDDVVRVPSSYATWRISTHGNDLKIEYALRIDPGGSVPAWLVNIAMADGPHHSFRNLKRMLGG